MAVNKSTSSYFLPKLDYFTRINFCFALFVTSRGSFSLAHRDPLPWWNQSDNFFRHQINALIQGHWWVEPNQLWGECFLRDEKCYSYFGLTPSIVRVPFLPLLNHFNTAGSAYFTAVALTLASSSFWKLANDVAPSFLKSSFLVRLLTSMLIGPASLLYFGTRTSVYHESLAWSIGFGSLALRRFYLWSKNSSPSNLFILILALSLSAGVHPGILPLAFIVSIGIGIQSFRNGLGIQRAIVRSGAIIISPIAIAFGTFWLKFDTPKFNGLWHQSIPENEDWARVLFENGGRVTALKFIPVQIYSALRIDGLLFDSVWPWVSIRFSRSIMTTSYQTPFHKDGVWFVEAVSGPSFVPFQFAILLISVFLLLKQIVFRKLSAPNLCFNLGLLASISYLLVVLMQVQIAQRYLTYFYVPTTFGLIFFLREVEQRWRSEKFRSVYVVFSSIGVIWTLFVAINFYFGSNL